METNLRVRRSNRGSRSEELRIKHSVRALHSRIKHLVLNEPISLLKYEQLYGIFLVLRLERISREIGVLTSLSEDVAEQLHVCLLNFLRDLD